MATGFTNNTFGEASSPGGVNDVKAISAVDRYAVGFQASVPCALDKSLPVTLAIFFQDRVPAQFISLPDNRLERLESALRDGLLDKALDQTKSAKHSTNGHAWH